MEKFWEAEVPEGLEQLVALDMAKHLSHLTILNIGKGEIRFQYDGKRKALLGLQSVIAISEALYVDVPRPKALLGHQHLTMIQQIIQQILTSHPENTFETCYLEAAGKDSAVMQRLQSELADKFRLKTSQEKGDLRIRVRPSRLTTQGWDVLVRITPRPHATRAWRTHNIRGALSAPVAHVMASMATITAQDRVLNLGCGSGTLLIEASKKQPQATYIGIDNHSDLLKKVTQEHFANANCHATLLHADMRNMPFAAGMFSVVIADLPFGQAISSPKENLVLYPTLLAESARVSQKNARFVLITHAINLFETVLKDFSQLWICKDIQKVTLNGLHPRIYTLIRQ